MEKTYLLILLTVPSKEEGEKIILSLLKKKWIACGSIHNAITSYYEWEGKMEKTLEYEVTLKTKEELYPKILSHIEKMHSYETPQILKLSIDASKKYLEWMNLSVK